MVEIITIILTIGVCYVMGHIEEIYFWLHEPEQPEDTEFDINQQFLDINRYGNDYAKRIKRSNDEIWGVKNKNIKENKKLISNRKK